VAKRKRGRGEGGVEQLPSGRWRGVVCRIVDGERVRASKTLPTKPEALAWVAQQVAAGTKPAAAGTVGEWLDTWLVRQKAGTGAANHATDKQIADQHLRPALGPKKLRDIDRRTVTDFLAGLSVTAHTRHVVGRTLRKLLNAAVEAGRLDTSPMGRKSVPKKPDTEARPLTAAQLAEVLALADASRLDGGRLGAMLRVWVDATLRPSEVLGLQWGDYDPATGVLQVRRSIDRHTGEIKPTKTRKSRRAVPLSAPTRAALDAIRPPAPPDTLPIFGGRKRRASVSGHRRYRNFSRDVWEKFRATFPEPLRWVVPYTFRHTAASLLLSAGVSVKAVAERLGHSDPSLTLRVYAHVLPGDQEKAAGVMGGFLPTVIPTPPQKR
jgi:integrase